MTMRTTVRSIKRKMSPTHDKSAGARLLIEAKVLERNLKGHQDVSEKHAGLSPACHEPYLGKA